MNVAARLPDSAGLRNMNVAQRMPNTTGLSLFSNEALYLLSGRNVPDEVLASSNRPSRPI
jgi:hypothetical protein